MERMYKISVYIPSAHLEVVKLAMFEQGAGRLGNYEHCAWQTKGQGQFRPLSGANPFIGQQNKLEIVEEYLIEMICDEASIKSAIKALKASHPYEEPAYTVVRLENISD
jgi:hypothetical protein